MEISILYLETTRWMEIMTIFFNTFSAVLDDFDYFYDERKMIEFPFILHFFYFDGSPSEECPAQ